MPSARKAFRSEAEERAFWEEHDSLAVCAVLVAGRGRPVYEPPSPVLSLASRLSLLLT